MTSFVTRERRPIHESSSINQSINQSIGFTYLEWFWNCRKSEWLSEWLSEWVSDWLSEESDCYCCEPSSCIADVPKVKEWQRSAACCFLPNRIWRMEWMHGVKEWNGWNPDGEPLPSRPQQRSCLHRIFDFRGAVPIHTTYDEDNSSSSGSSSGTATTTTTRVDGNDNDSYDDARRSYSISKRKHAQWEDYFQLLVEYQHHHKMTKAPNKNLTLGRWIEG